MPRTGRCSSAHASSSNIHLLNNFHGHFELILFYSIHIYVVESKRGSSSWDPSRRAGSKDRNKGDCSASWIRRPGRRGLMFAGRTLRNDECGKCLHLEAAGAQGQFLLLPFLFSCLQLISRYKAYHTVDV